MMGSAPPPDPNGMAALWEILRLVSDPAAAQQRLSEIDTAGRQLTARAADLDKREDGIKAKEAELELQLAAARDVVEREVALKTNEAAVAAREAACRLHDEDLARERDRLLARQDDLEGLGRRLDAREIEVSTRERNMEAMRARLAEAMK